MSDFYNNYDYSIFQSEEMMNLKYNRGVKAKCKILKLVQPRPTNLNIYTHEIDQKTKAEETRDNTQAELSLLRWKIKQLSSFTNANQSAAVFAQMARNAQNENQNQKNEKIEARKLPEDIKKIAETPRIELEKVESAKKESDIELDKQSRAIVSITEDHADYIKFKKSQYSCDKDTHFQKIAWRPESPE